MSKRNVVHVEIPAVNPEAAGKFYQELFGWKLRHDHELNYSMWEDDTGPAGGFPAVSDQNPAGQVLVYIDSEDIDADLKKVEELGGTVLMKKDEIPQTGWFALFKDPTGNVIGLYTNMNPGDR